MGFEIQTIDIRHILNPPASGGLFISRPFGGRGSLIETGGLFNLEKTMVFVLHKELGYKWKSSSTKRLEVVQPRIRVKSELFQLVNKIPDQSTQIFTIVID